MNVLRSTPLLLAVVACSGHGGVTDSGTPDSGVTEDGPSLCINEFMATNRTTIADGIGDQADWIELHNPTDAAIDLAGWTITDTLAEPGLHVLDALTVPAGGYLVLWADGSPSEGPDHVGFKLAAEGDVIALFRPDGTTAAQLSFGRQASDISAARTADCGHTWELTATPTPGAANGTGNLGTAPPDWPGPGPACDLQSDLDTPWFLEGDTIGFSAWCSGALDTADAHIVPVRVPDGASWNNGDLRLSWATGPADGGRWDLVLAVSPTSQPWAIPTAEIVTVWVADDFGNPDNVPVDPTTYTEEWGLPVVHLYPEGGLSQSEGPTTVVFRGHTYPGTAKIRGAFSAGYDKPSYTLQFTEAELPIEAWGVTRDHLVLLTTFDDNAYVRQKLIYDQWAAIADYWGVERLVPRTFWTVVYLNGSYWGLYVGLDRIDNEFVDQMGFDRDANVYKAVSHDANFYLTNASGGTKSSLHAGLEKKEGDPVDDFSDLDALVAWTGGATDAEVLAGAAGKIDLDEFMDWFLLVHYSDSADSAGKNCYLANDPLQGGFRYVPWDFNHAWGQGWYTYRVSSGSLHDFAWNNRVFAAIHARASATLWSRFAEMREDGPFAPDWLTSTVDGYYAQIQPSAERDWAVWATSYRTYGSWAGSRNSAGDWTDFEGEKAYLYQWLDDREALFWANHP